MARHSSATHAANQSRHHVVRLGKVIHGKSHSARHGKATKQKVVKLTA